MLDGSLHQRAWHLAKRIAIDDSTGIANPSINWELATPCKFQGTETQPGIEDFIFDEFVEWTSIKLPEKYGNQIGEENSQPNWIGLGAAWRK